MTLDTLNYFNFWHAVPLEGSASYDEIAEQVDLPEEVCRRLLEHALTLRLFAQVEPASPKSRICHSARSAVFARASGLRAVLTTMMDNAAPPLACLPRALNRSARGKRELSRDFKDNAWTFAHSGGLLGKYEDSWAMIEDDGEGDEKGWRQKDMVEGMRSIKNGLKTNELLLNMTDWTAAGEAATVVDIGGSGGHDMIELAEKYPGMRIDVQDLPKCRPDFDATMPAALKDRVTFTAHDFFQPQPVQADLFLIKFTIYDWPKPKAVEILRSLIPALKPGSKILFMDFVGKPTPEGVVLPRTLRKTQTGSDVRLMAMFGHSERTTDDYRDLFAEADGRFEVTKVDDETKPPVLMMEVTWRG